MLIKKINFNVIDIKTNEDGFDIQKEIENLTEEYKKNNYFNNLYNGCNDDKIEKEKLYVTEYQGQEFRGYLEECQYQNQKNYKVYIKDYKGNCFHIGYVPFRKSS